MYLIDTFILVPFGRVIQCVRKKRPACFL